MLSRDRVSGAALMREWQEKTEGYKESDRGKLSPSDRRSINKTLTRSGFDGNMRFRSMGKAVATAFTVLKKHGVEWDEPVTASMTHGDHGSTSIHVALSNPDTPANPKRVTNSMFYMQWTKMRTGYEVVAYMT